MEQSWLRTNANCWTDTTLRGVNFTRKTLFNQYSVRSWHIRRDDPLDPLTHIEFKSFNLKTHHDVNFVWFNGLNLVYCCLKKISFTSTLPRIPRNLKFIDEVSSQIYWWALRLSLNISKRFILLQVITSKISKWSKWLLPQLLFSLSLILLQNYISL